MIIQGSNLPIIFTFNEDVSSLKNIEVDLYTNKEVLKHWSKKDLIIDKETVTAELSQEETINFPKGMCYIEIKWLEDNLTNFANIIKDQIVFRNDKTIMGGE